jgi:hypothetical protein
MAGCGVPHPEQPALLPHVADDGVLQEQPRLILSSLQTRPVVDLRGRKTMQWGSFIICVRSSTARQREQQQGAHERIRSTPSLFDRKGE